MLAGVKLLKWGNPIMNLKLLMILSPLSEKARIQPKPSLAQELIVPLKATGSARGLPCTRNVLVLRRD